MRIYDISLGIQANMPIWPNNPGVELEKINAMEAGANANVSKVTMGVHTGTHVDAPYHFLPEGTTVEALPLKLMIGRAHVVEMMGVDVITAADLKNANIPPRTRRVLFKTRNSAFWERGETGFHEDFVGVAADAAAWLVERRIQLVGVDYLSVAPWKQSRPTHQVLLEAGTGILEGVNLTGIRPGRYILYCLPLKLVGSDGAPARAILLGI